MASYFEIPLSAQAQTLTIDLAGVTYQLVLNWNTQASLWVLDIYDSAGVTPILRGISLVANVDLLAAYPDLDFGGKLVAQTDNAPDVPPTYGNLGTTGHLYFITP